MTEKSKIFIKKVESVKNFLENQDYDEGICGFWVESSDEEDEILVYIILDIEWVKKIPVRPELVGEKMRRGVKGEIKKWLGIDVFVGSTAKNCNEITEMKNTKLNYLISESQLKILVEQLRDSSESPLYHHTSEVRALKIMDEDKLRGSVPSEDYLVRDRRLAKSKDKAVVSFTRDKNFEPGLSIGSSWDLPKDLNVIFVLDKNKLKQRYKVEPFNYSWIDPNAEPEMFHEKNPELEERVLTKNIYPLRNYVMDIIYKGSDPDIQEKIDDYLNQ